MSARRMLYLSPSRSHIVLVRTALKPLRKFSVFAPETATGKITASVFKAFSSSISAGRSLNCAAPSDAVFGKKSAFLPVIITIFFANSSVPQRFLIISLTMENPAICSTGSSLQEIPISPILRFSTEFKISPYTLGDKVSPNKIILSVLSQLLKIPLIPDNIQPPATTNIFSHENLNASIDRAKSLSIFSEPGVIPSVTQLEVQR